MTIYIAGPMTGIEHYNYPAFDAAEVALNGRLSQQAFDFEGIA